MVLVERVWAVCWKVVTWSCTATEIVLFAVLIPLLAWVAGAGLGALVLWVLYTLIGAIGALGSC